MVINSMNLNRLIKLKTLKFFIVINTCTASKLLPSYYMIINIKGMISLWKLIEKRRISRLSLDKGIKQENAISFKVDL